MALLTRANSESDITRDLTKFQTGDAHTAAAVAVACAAQADRGGALQYMEKAYANGDNEVLLAVWFPVMDPLRGDARSKELMKKLGLPE